MSGRAELIALADLAHLDALQSAEAALRHEADEEDDLACSFNRETASYKAHDRRADLARDEADMVKAVRLALGNLRATPDPAP